MTVSIGVDYTSGQWKSCVIDRGHLTELRAFSSSDELLEFVDRICTLYPEPTLGVSLDLALPFCPLQNLSDEQFLLRDLFGDTVSEQGIILQRLSTLSLHSYCVPSVAYLPTMPLARRLLRVSPGSPREVCAVIALLHHMRAQEASWVEMNFFYLHADERGTCALVLKEGQIIDGIGILRGSVPARVLDLEKLEGVGAEFDRDSHQFRQAWQDAFWEGLHAELAGLIATHHIEDIVVLGKESDRLIERLAETFQVYLFPRTRAEHEGYEATLGAGLLAEGLDQPGKAAELVSHLQIRQAQALTLPSDPSL